MGINLATYAFYTVNFKKLRFVTLCKLVTLRLGKPGATADKNTFSYVTPRSATNKLSIVTAKLGKLEPTTDKLLTVTLRLGKPGATAATKHSHMSRLGQLPTNF